MKHLETAIQKYHENESRETIEVILASFLEALAKKEKIIIPVSKEDDKVSVTTVKNNEGKYNFACFTSEEKLNKGQPTEFERINLEVLVSMALEEKLDIVVNPWDDSFVLTYEAINSLIDYLNNLEEEA